MSGGRAASGRAGGAEGGSGECATSGVRGGRGAEGRPPDSAAIIFGNRWASEASGEAGIVECEMELVRPESKGVNTNLGFQPCESNLESARLSGDCRKRAPP